MLRSLSLQDPRGHYSGRTGLLSTLTAPQSHGLTVLLKFGDELIALLDHIRILLVLVVRSIRLDNALDAVNGAGDAVGRDEASEVPGDYD